MAGPTAGAARLVDGIDRVTFDAGRLEICLNGSWGTVCDFNFGPKEAVVACRHLGFTTGIPVNADDPEGFGYGSYLAQIHLDSVNCTGDEDRITSCANVDLPDNDCSH
ncbi:hypothetical protein PLESTF_001295200 [Pleodorina starrii]|nr:hypothetical protein PLESTF_001295200 [Pleodorina starrii]